MKMMPATLLLWTRSSGLDEDRWKNLDMRRSRGTAFWRGPGLLLGCFGVLVAGGGLVALAVAGPPLIAGLALMVLGAAVVWARGGFGDYAFTKAQRTYIWPRDPDRMKPNAELESGVMVVVAVAIGIGMVIGGLSMVLGTLD